MESLYNIESELLRMFDTIEENGGEVTDEELEALSIKQGELKAKLESYYRAICVWENNANECKTEKQRINNTQKKFENRVSRLKEAMLFAVQQFGDTGKTNKYIELPTMRLSTRNNKSLVVNEERTKLFIDYFTSYIRELYANGIIESGEDVDLSGMLAVINAEVKAEYDDEVQPFTLSDLETLKVKISIEDSILNMFKNHSEALNLLGSDPIFATCDNVTPKEDFKRNIESHIASGIPCTTLANIEINQSLLIK